MIRTLRQVPDPALPRILPVILAGGSGTRLWPLSREQFPKQLIELTSNESPLSATARRLNGIANASLDDTLLLVCSEQHRTLSAAQVTDRAAPARILLEPAPRNTAPALTLAALDASAFADDPVLAVMPADHVIVDVGAFQDAIARAARYAEEGAIVTLGVLPRRAERATATSRSARRATAATVARAAIRSGVSSRSPTRRSPSAICNRAITGGTAGSSSRARRSG